MKLLLLVLIPLLFRSGSCQDSIRNSRQLGCERIYGNYNDMQTLFRRPMQAGDKFVVNGTASPRALVIRIQIDTLVPRAVPIHVRSDMGAEMIYNSWIDGKWTLRETGPQPYVKGEQFLITIEYTGTSFLVYSGSTLIKTFAQRTPNSWELAAANLVGTWATNWIELVCRNPPSPGNGGSGSGPGNGHGHGHGHGSSSSSSEEC